MKASVKLINAFSFFFTERGPNLVLFCFVLCYYDWHLFMNQTEENQH